MKHFLLLKKFWRMNKIHFWFLTILLSSIWVTSHAQYLSGKLSIVITEPTIAPVQFDFSEVDDSCSFFGDNLCSVSTTDVKIIFSTTSTIDTLISNYGILDLGVFDTNGMSQIGEVPTSGFSNKIVLQLEHIYAIKTSEGNYGAIFYKAHISGGFDVKVYSWAYQKNGSNDLTPPSSIKHNRTPGVAIGNKRNELKIILFQNRGNLSYHDFTIYNLLGQKHAEYSKVFLISPGIHLVAGKH